MPSARPVVYFDKGGLNATLLAQMEDLATDIATVPSSQLRRFYGDVVAFDRRLSLERDMGDGAILAQMGLLKARAAYATARKQITDPLLRFFVDHAAAVKNQKDFGAFRRVFETLIAYHKFHERKPAGRD